MVRRVIVPSDLSSLEAAQHKLHAAAAAGATRLEIDLPRSPDTPVNQRFHFYDSPEKTFPQTADSGNDLGIGAEVTVGSVHVRVDGAPGITNPELKYKDPVQHRFVSRYWHRGGLVRAMQAKTDCKRLPWLPERPFEQWQDPNDLFKKSDADLEWEEKRFDPNPDAPPVLSSLGNSVSASSAEG